MLPLSLVVAALATLAPFTIDTYLPSFPDIGTDLSASHAQMQLTLSLYLFASAVATLIYGPLSDGFGRRRVIMVSLVIYGLSSIACAFAVTIEQLILLRIGQGLSASAGMVIGRAMVRDVFHGAEAQKVMARVMLLFGIAPAFAPIIGGLLHDLYGWHSVFLFLTGVSVILLLMIWLGTAETLPEERRHSIHPVAIARAYGAAFRHRHYLALVFSFAMMFSGFFIYVAGAPAVIYGFLGLGVNDFWLMFVPMVAAIMVGSQISSWLAGKLSPESTVWLGCALMFLSSLVNALQSVLLTPSTIGVIAPVVGYLLGMALTIPNISLMAIDCFPRNRGMASALQSFVQMGFTALVVGAVVPWVATTLFGMAFSMLLLGMIGILLWAVRGSVDKAQT